MQVRQPLADAGIERAVDADMIGVGGSVQRFGSGEQLGIGPAAVHLADQGAADQVVHAVTDPGTHLYFLARRQLQLPQHDVDRRGQVGDAVHQGAVEIEEKGRDILKHD